MKQQNHHQNMSPEDRFGRVVAARLSEAATSLPHDISERLRVARLQALAKRPQVQAASDLMSNGGHSATLTIGGGDHHGFGLWRWIASMLPLLALVAGLIALNALIGDERARELADIDAALLTDDLPPAAYTDPGFLQFLKSTPPDQAR
jgi:hypothetical protein